MCGIVGFINSGLSQENSASLVKKMIDEIKHRGPDNNDFIVNEQLTLGHVRLSIIDLSDSANQPMVRHQLILTFNGEVYNYKELRIELEKLGHQFTTDSDTEVILNSYKQWGEKCVERFVGMWAFAIWDEVNQSLFCSRDRFGIKPFNYYMDGERFFFGSEYKIFKHIPGFNNKINLNQVYRGLQLGWGQYKNETYYEHIKNLEAGHNLVYKNGKITIKKYWEPIISQKLKGIEEQAERFKELFFDSIKLHVRSDVPVGSCLSGGLDSSAIASTISLIFPEIDMKTFSIYYDGAGEVDERPWINEVIQQNPKQLTPFFHSPSDDSIKEAFHSVQYHFDYPLFSSSSISQYFLMQLANREGIKVVVNGQGADEYLAGYGHAMYRYLADHIRSLNIGGFAGTLSNLKKRHDYGFSKLLDISLKSGLSSVLNEDPLYKFEYKNYYPFFPTEKKDDFFPVKTPKGKKLGQFLYHQLMLTSLPTLLHSEDRNSMAHAIESRVPFLDHRLVEFVLNLNNELILGNGVSKKILRKALGGIIPDKIANRTDKKGFVTPGEEKWLSGPLQEVLLNQNFNHLDFLNQNKVKKIVNEYKSGNKKNAKILWKICTLNYWLENTSL